MTTQTIVKTKDGSTQTDDVPSLTTTILLNYTAKCLPYYIINIMQRLQMVWMYKYGGEHILLTVSCPFISIRG